MFMAPVHAGMKRNSPCASNIEEQAVGVKRRRVDDRDTTGSLAGARSWAVEGAWRLKNTLGNALKTLLRVVKPSSSEVVVNAIECNGMDGEPTNEMHSMFGAQRGGGGGGSGGQQEERDQPESEAAAAGVGDRQESSRGTDMRTSGTHQGVVRGDAASRPTGGVGRRATRQFAPSPSHSLRQPSRIGSSYLHRTQQMSDHVTYNELLRSSGSVLPSTHASSTSCATTTRDPSPSNKLALSLPASCLPSKSRTIQPILYSTPVYDHSSSSTAEQSFTNHTLPFSTKRLRSTTTSAWAPRHSYIDSSSSATPATSSSSHYDDLSSLPKTPSVIHHSDHSDVAEQVLSSTSQSNNSYSITSHQHTSPLSLPFPPPFNLHHVEYLPSSTLTTSMNWLKTLEHSSTLADYQTRIEAAEKYHKISQTRRLEAEESRYSKLLDRIKSLELQGKKKSEEKTIRSDLKLELTDSQAEMVRRAWGRGYMDEVFSEGYVMKITRRDLSTLRGLEWLNDEVINFYLKLVVDQVNSGGTCKVHLFNSFFYPKLLSNGYSGVRRWTKKVDVFAHDILLLPVHLGMHWCLAAVDFRSKQISYYDSLKGSNRQCLSMLRDYLVSEAKDKKQMVYDVSDWTLSTPKDIPEQRNGSDCGVFTCMYARHIAKDQPFMFSQEDMQQIRMLMVAEIISKSLL